MPPADLVKQAESLNIDDPFIANIIFGPYGLAMKKKDVQMNMIEGIADNHRRVFIPCSVPSSMIIKQAKDYFKVKELCRSIDKLEDYNQISVQCEALRTVLE